MFSLSRVAEPIDCKDFIIARVMRIVVEKILRKYAHILVRVTRFCGFTCFSGFAVEFIIPAMCQDDRFSPCCPNCR